MAAELRELTGHIFVVDVACGLEEDWGDDRIGAGVRLDEHNETHLPGLQDDLMQAEEHSGDPARTA